MLPFSFVELDPWDAHEKLILSILKEALSRLAKESGWGNADEWRLNRRLFQLFVAVNRTRAVRGKTSFDYSPQYDAGIPPHIEDPHLISHEHKRPDFQMSLCDHSSRDSANWLRQYTIECKRLHQRVAGRDFAAQYVTQGIKRFVDPAHSYGLRTRSGAMVAYLQQFSYAGALREVNSHARQLPVPDLQACIPPTKDPYSLDHELDRAFPEARFRLTHLWTQVRAHSPELDVNARGDDPPHRVE